MPDFDDDDLKLALTHHLVETIITADGVVDDDELTFVASVVDPQQLRDSGFLDDDGALTPAFVRARSQALHALPSRLSLMEKLDLLTLCLNASLADQGADAYELVHIRVAARLLGLTEAQLSAHLGTLEQVGTVDDHDLIDDSDVHSDPRVDDLDDEPTET